MTKSPMFSVFLRPALMRGSLAAVILAAGAHADVVTTPTIDTALLGAALNPIGVAITDVQIRNGADLQFGVYSNFSIAPIVMPDGVVMSSGSTVDLSRLAEVHEAGYDPASPPARVVNAMKSGATPEFLAYGIETGSINNFVTAEDVAVLEVTFDLKTSTNVKFDFVFGSVEYPFWTDSFTDAFLVFLDERVSTNQICFDANDTAIQVGQSFANLVTTADNNTAFSSPHGMIVTLTTTTAVLDAGTHTLWFEVGDVNDMILDSAVFITNLRAEAGTEGTGETHNQCDADLDGDDIIGAADIAALLSEWGAQGGSADLNSDDIVNAADLAMLLSTWGPCN